MLTSLWPHIWRWTIGLVAGQCINATLWVAGLRPHFLILTAIDSAASLLLWAWLDRRARTFTDALESR